MILFSKTLLFVFVFASNLSMPFSPFGAVNDFASVIPHEYKIKMEELSREVLKKTGTAIVVATFETIGENDINEFSNKLYELWGIGKKGEDKGILIVLAIKERKIRVETGYGIEGILPDGLVGNILDNYAISHLKRGDYGLALYSCMLAFAKVLEKEKEIQHQKKRASKNKGTIFVFLLPLVIFLILSLLQNRMIRRRLRGPIFFGGWMGGPYGFGPFGGGFGGFGGGLSGGGGATRSF